MPTPLLLFLLLFAGDEKKTVRVTCPVDGTTFSATEILSTNQWGGVDRDWCPHAVRSFPMEHYVWVCPGCAFAGVKKDYIDAPELSLELKEKIRGGLKPPVEIRKGMSQDDIPGHAKYDLLAQRESLRGADALQIGRTWIKASWASRQRGAVDLPDFDEWTDLKRSRSLLRTPIELKTKNRAELELEQGAKLARELTDGKPAPGPGRILVLYLAAWLHRRHGENAEALRWLGELGKCTGQNSVVDDAAKKMSASIEVERKYQALAVESLTRALDGGLDERKKADTLYMLGELHRRLGDPAKARDSYDRCLAVAKETLKTLAAEQRKLVE